MDIQQLDLRSYWESFSKALDNEGGTAVVDGITLSIGAVIGVSRYGVGISVGETALQKVAAAEEIIRTSLDNGHVIYGVNTGFGGSADTRTKQVEALQRELMRGLNYGFADTSQQNISPKSKLKAPLPLEDPRASTCMPESWVRAAMVVRLNSLVRGASGVKVSTIHTLTQLIDKNITPVVPIRGSISASGDLSPLSYIGGVMQGKPMLKTWVRDSGTAAPRLCRADRALAEASITPIKLGAKEGLAIVNGTAISAAVGALAVHEITMLTGLSQLLTAMSVEALRGTDESFDPFFAVTRPHPGQIESSKNILALLAGSQLVHRNNGTEEASLRQDRYSIRTAPQWLGPVMEDLALARQQITTEINSVTDNPLIDTATGRVLHGGNFQAKAITSATEKARLVAQSLGRMLSVQCTEIINPATNRGLPPNLVVDDPSGSFLWKGTDILIAALTSELGFLASPIRPHVQSAEMGNQALNSLALISARYTVTAAAVLTHLAAAHAVAVCQALDLRTMHLKFLTRLRPQFLRRVRDVWQLSSDTECGESSQEVLLWTTFVTSLDGSAGVDPGPRFKAAFQTLIPVLLELRTAVSSLLSLPNTKDLLDKLATWAREGAEEARLVFEEVRAAYIDAPDASESLGIGTKRFYAYLRWEIGVPFLSEDQIATPTQDRQDELEAETGEGVGTMGDYIGKVYRALQDGAAWEVVVKCLSETQ